MTLSFNLFLTNCLWIGEQNMFFAAMPLILSIFSSFKFSLIVPFLFTTLFRRPTVVFVWLSLLSLLVLRKREVWEKCVVPKLLSTGFDFQLILVCELIASSGTKLVLWWVWFGGLSVMPKLCVEGKREAPRCFGDTEVYNGIDDEGFNVGAIMSNESFKAGGRLS